MSAEQISGIFGSVLELPSVSVDEDFFQLGGDSLLAIRVLSAVAREYGVEFSFEDFAEEPTPAGLHHRILSGQP